MLVNCKVLCAKILSFCLCQRTPFLPVSLEDGEVLPSCLLVLVNTFIHIWAISRQLLAIAISVSACVFSVAQRCHGMGISVFPLSETFNDRVLPSVCPSIHFHCHQPIIMVMRRRISKISLIHSILVLILLGPT